MGYPRRILMCSRRQSGQVLSALQVIDDCETANQLSTGENTTRGRPRIPSRGVAERWSSVFAIWRESSRSVASRFGVAVSSVVKWSQRYRATGSVGPGTMGGHRKRVLEPHRAFIKERINKTPHLTLHRLKDELAARGVTVSHNAVWMFLRREGLRFKKPLFALEQGRAYVGACRKHKTGYRGTHRNYYDGGRYVHATSMIEGYEGHIYQIVDIAVVPGPVGWRRREWCLAVYVFAWRCIRQGRSGLSSVYCRWICHTRHIGH